MDLIDRASLDFSFDRRCFSEGDEQYVRGADDAIGVVINAPAIDAVPVVRCRECKYARKSEEAFEFDGGTPLCECAYMTQPNRWNEFCSWGERKEAEHG